MSEEDGEGGKTRMGDIVLFATWQQELEEEQEEDEDEDDGGSVARKDQGLKRSRQAVDAQVEDRAFQLAGVDPRQHRFCRQIELQLDGCQAFANILNSGLLT